MTESRPNVLLMFPCSWRRDSLKSMPLLSKLMRQDGWEYWSQHYGVAHCSDPNFLTLLTGGHPDETGVQAQMGAQYAKEFPTLQKRLGKAGYYTWAYEPIKVPKFYLHGFDELIWHLTSEVSPINAPAPKKAIRQAGTRPWFGFMRMMDTHYPYMGKPLKQEDVSSDYTNACAHLDKFMYRLSKWVIKNYPNTIIVIGADHGEMLGEHGLWDHLFTLKNPLVHVPLMVYQPDNGPAQVRQDLTQHQDVAGLIMSRTGLREMDRIVKRDGLWMSAWGIGHRDPWKHRSLVVRHEGSTLQYTVNWHIEHGASFELHVDDDYANNWFGANDVSHGIAEAFIEKYPTFPKPDFALPPDKIQGNVDLLAYDAVALGDGVMIGEDGMVDEQTGAGEEGEVAVSIRPAWREPAALS